MLKFLANATEQENKILKVENYVLFGGLSEDFSPGGSLSGSSEGLRRGEGGGRINRSFCNRNQVVRTSEDDC